MLYCTTKIKHFLIKLVVVQPEDIGFLMNNSFMIFLTDIKNVNLFV